MGDGELWGVEGQGAEVGWRGQGVLESYSGR